MKTAWTFSSGMSLLPAASLQWIIWAVNVTTQMSECNYFLFRNVVNSVVFIFPSICWLSKRWVVLSKQRAPGPLAPSKHFVSYIFTSTPSWEYPLYHYIAIHCMTGSNVWSWGPVDFHLVSRWEDRLSAVPSPSLCVEYCLDKRTDVPVSVYMTLI